MRACVLVALRGDSYKLSSGQNTCQSMTDVRCALPLYPFGTILFLAEMDANKALNTGDTRRLRIVVTYFEAIFDTVTWLQLGRFFF